MEQEASHSTDSFFQDGQEQSAAAMAQEGHSQNANVRVVTVPEPSLDQGVQHSQQDQVLTPDPALAPRKTSNRSPGDRSWVDENRRTAEEKRSPATPNIDWNAPGPHWDFLKYWKAQQLPPHSASQQTHTSRAQPTSGPSRRDRAEAGSSRTHVASPALSARVSMSSYVSSNRSRSPLRRSNERREASVHSTPHSSRRGMVPREV